MSTCKTSAVIEDIKYWLRLATFLHKPLKLALLYILHNDGNDSSYNGLPRDPEDLYNFFKSHQNTITDLWKKKRLVKEQVLILLPQGDNKTYSHKFDCTLVAFVIKKFMKLPRPSAGWDCKTPPIRDQTVAANYIRAREWRNYVHHEDPKRIDEAEFEKKWKEGVGIIEGIGLNYPTDCLKNTNLDPKSDMILQSFETYFSNYDYQLSKVSEEYKAQKEMIDSLKTEVEELKNRKSTPPSKNDYVLKKTIEIVCQHIGGKWRQVVQRVLNIDQSKLEKIDTKVDSTEADKLRCCFEIAQDKVTWEDLKYCLIHLDEFEIIEKAKESTLLTLGREAAQKELKKVYEVELENWLRDHPFFEHSDGSYPTGKSAYVELAVIEAEEMDEIWKNGEIVAHLELKHFNRRKIPFQDILRKKDSFVVVRGIAGIGKSTMIQSYVSRWIDSSTTFGEEEAKIDFVFKFTCRDLNVVGEIEGVEDLLKMKYPTVFRCITMDDLFETPSSVLILLDGIDELRSVSNLRNPESWAEDTKLLRCVSDLLKTTTHKTIIAGRPEACRIITRKRHKKMIEICGFNPDSVKTYIDQSFFGNEETAAKVLAKIQETSYLRAMATIPIYLWVICGMYHEDIDIKFVRNTTELCCYACLLFIQKHLKKNELKKNFSDMSLLDLCKEPYILNIVLSLAQLSKQTYAQKKVVFQAKDIPEGISVVLEETGFVVKEKTNTTELYQFRHLVLQEFLSALQLFLSKENVDDNPQLESCFPMIAGLWGIVGRGEDALLVSFLTQLRIKSTHWLKRLTFGMSKINIQEKLEQIIKHRLLHSDKIEISGSSSNLLRAIFEYHGDFSDSIVQECQKKEFVIKDLLFNHDISNTIYFVEKFKVNGVHNIMVTNFNNSKLPDNFKVLIEQYFKNTDRKKRICNLRGGTPMTIASVTLYRNIETNLIVTLDPTDTENTHYNLLKTMIDLVGVLIVHASFSQRTELEECIDDTSNDAVHIEYK